MEKDLRKTAAESIGAFQLTCPICGTIGVQSRDTLAKEGIYVIEGEIDVDALAPIRWDILNKHLNIKGKYKDLKEITIYINSPGGDLIEAWALIDLLENSRFKINTIGWGECQSGGCLILMAGDKGRRKAYPHTTIMAHNFSAALSGSYQDLKEGSKAFDKEHQRLVDFFIRKSRYSTAKAVEKHFLKGTDAVFHPDEAMKHGLIDSIIGSCPKPKKKVVKKVTKK